MMVTVIDSLKEIQTREHLTNGQFAQRLGIHEKSWSRIKGGRSGLSYDLIRKAVRAWPELAVVVLDEIRRPITQESRHD